MVTYNKYFEDILHQILSAYETLQKLDDKPGDLDIINKQILKITALFQVIINKVRNETNPSSSHVELAVIATKYLDTYSFDREIAIMAPLYSEDTNRIHNIRFKIIESFIDTKLVSKINEVMEDLVD